MMMLVIVTRSVMMVFSITLKMDMIAALAGLAEHRSAFSRTTAGIAHPLLSLLFDGE